MGSENPSARSIAGFWRSLSRLDQVLAVVMVSSTVTALVLSGGAADAILQLVAFASGLWFATRLVRRHLRKILWRLRDRLLVAYGFIALVPVVLIVTLASLLIYVFVGQTAAFMVTSELDRRVATMIRIAERLAEAPGERREQLVSQVLEVEAERLRGLELLVSDERPWRYPKDATIEAPNMDWGDAGGLVVKDSLMYAWAHIVRPSVRVTAMLPLTSRFLAALAPNIGEISFIRFDPDNTQPRSRLRFHRSNPKDDEDFDTPRNVLPPKQHWLDAQILWWTALPAYLWEQPGRVEDELLSVRTRPVAVMQTLFTQKIDFYRGMVPAALLSVSFAFLVAEIVALVIGVNLTRTITRSMGELYEGTERIREGDFSHRIHAGGNDQMARLGESFNDMTAHIERLLVISKENERLQTELEIAREVQNQLYPQSLPEMRTMQLTACCAPARMVSGDYYDYTRLDDRHVALAIGDVAGKGISAALLMATVQSALRTQLGHCLEMSRNGELVISTSALVSKMNQHLYANTKPEKYATFCFGVYDEVTRVLTYTNAGHLPPILLRGGKVEPLEVNGIVVGAFPFATYKESRLSLEPGDLLLFYTDGVTEPENAYGEQFGEQRLMDLLLRNASQPPEEILTCVIDAVREWTGTSELQDDLTLLLAHRGPAEC